MPKARTGSLIYRPDEKSWRGAVTMPDGRRKWIRAQTEEEARAKMAAIDPLAVPTTRSAGGPARQAAIALAVLQRATANRWPLPYTAQVLIASLTPRRVHWGIVGPCAYCGDEAASTVDHAIPIARGGADVRENVVSSCRSCNQAKGNRTAEEFRQA